MSAAPDPAATRIRGDAPAEGQPPATSRPTRDAQAWAGPLMTVLCLLAVVVAGYLTWVKLTGTAPACAILSGCETVENSRYSTFLGVPVAAFGMLGAAAMLGGSLLWWLRSDRRGLMVAYLVGLASLPVLAFLTYLELAVIGAVCMWCVAFAILVIVAWLVATVVLRSPSPEEG